jgi:hypothetical protein
VSRWASDGCIGHPPDQIDEKRATQRSAYCWRMTSTPPKPKVPQEAEGHTQ